MPALKASWLIGFRFGSVESKFGMRLSRKLSGSSIPEVAARHVRARQRERVGRVERAVADVPDVAAEPAARQLVLRPVEVAAPAAVQLQRGRRRARRSWRRGAARACRRTRTRMRYGWMSVRNDGIVSRSVRRPRFSVRFVDRPLVLHVERPDVGGRLAARAEVVHLVVAVRAAIRSMPVSLLVNALSHQTHT